jgi:glutaredoxin-dependent peroxiredoxin
MLQIGQKAPDFKLVDADKKEVSLADFKGKNLVLFFFPMAWTGVCTKEMCSVQEDFNDYAGMNAQAIGISVDSHFALKQFSDQFKLQFPLLSDFNKEAIKAYDIVQKSFAAVYHDTSRRATFVIDKEGIIRFMDILENPGDFPNMDAIKDAVKKLS